MTDMNDTPTTEPGTLPLWRLLNNLNTLHEFLLLHGLLAEQLPLVRAQLPQTDPQRAALLEQLLARMNYEHKQHQFHYLQAEIVMTRLVDGFHSYLVDVLRAYFRAHPEAIDAKVKRGKPKKVAGMGTPVAPEIEFYAMQGADKLLQDSGFEKIVEYLGTRLGLSFTLSDEQMQTAIHTIATRNIIGHNRGRINERFLRRTGQVERDDDVIDTPLITSLDEAIEYMHNLVIIAEIIDKALIKKFGRTIFEQFSPFPSLTEGAHFVLW